MDLGSGQILVIYWRFSYAFIALGQEDNGCGATVPGPL